MFSRFTNVLIPLIDRFVPSSIEINDTSVNEEKTTVPGGSVQDNTFLFR